MPCAKFLKRRRPRLAVVLIGGKGSYAERKKATTTQGSPCLFHPIRAQQLTKVVHQAMRKACLRIIPAAVPVAGNAGDYTLEEWREMAKKAKFSPIAPAKLMQRSLRDLELHSKAKFALTPGVWLNNERMRLASELLLTHLEIKEIADQLGFKQLSHFSRMFKEYHQLSPRAFRRRFRSKPEQPTAEPSPINIPTKPQPDLPGREKLFPDR